MRQQPVVTDPNRKSCGKVETQKKRKVDRPRPKPEPKQSADVQAHYQKTVSPIDLRKPVRIFLLVGIECGIDRQYTFPSAYLNAPVPGPVARCCRSDQVKPTPPVSTLPNPGSVRRVETAVSQAPTSSWLPRARGQ